MRNPVIEPDGDIMVAEWLGGSKIGFFPRKDIYRKFLGLIGIPVVIKKVVREDLEFQP